MTFASIMVSVDLAGDAEALLDLASEGATDLIVMGAYGHGRLREAVLAASPGMSCAVAPSAASWATDDRARPDERHDPSREMPMTAVSRRSTVRSPSLPGS
ncbi:universal stress protein [Methylobacterium sp. E-025]|uniref:universal stress protein n=1 Tax=Methylobacterium sp. E-025 TaxID=2836561 RepID=UPI001FB9053E|nr:universal stress protein [Methylobacterium sp. E-025]MCJ2109918.1 universal stress protein [Methylobacterium sp. E-025]